MTQRQETKIVVQGSKLEKLTREQLREQIEQLAYTLLSMRSRARPRP